MKPTLFIDVTELSFEVVNRLSTCMFNKGYWFHRINLEDFFPFVLLFLYMVF